MLLQKKVPSELEALTAPPQSATREGLATLGSPEYAARPTWLAAVPQSSGSTAGQWRRRSIGGAWLHGNGNRASEGRARARKSGGERQFATRVLCRSGWNRR